MNRKFTHCVHFRFPRAAGVFVLIASVLLVLAPPAIAMEMSHSHGAVQSSSPLIDNNVIEHVLQAGIPMPTLQFTYQILYSFLMTLFYGDQMPADTPHV